MVVTKTSRSSSIKRSNPIDSKGSGRVSIVIRNSVPSTKIITVGCPSARSSGNLEMLVPEQHQWSSLVLPSIPTYRKVGTVLWRRNVSETHYDIERKYVFCRENDLNESGMEGNESGYFVYLKDGLMLPVSKRRVEFFRGGGMEANAMQQEMRHFFNIPPLNDLLEEKKDGKEEREATVQNSSTAEVVIAARGAEEDLNVELQQVGPQAVSSSFVKESLGPSSTSSHVKKEEENLEGNVEYVPLLPRLCPERRASFETLISERTVPSSVTYSSTRISTDYHGPRVPPHSRHASLLATSSAPRGVPWIGTISVTVPQEEVYRYTEKVDANGNVEFDVFGQETLGVQPFYVDYKGEKVFIPNRNRIRIDRLATYAKQRRRSSTAEGRRKSSVFFTSSVLA